MDRDGTETILAPMKIGVKGEKCRGVLVLKTRTTLLRPLRSGQVPNPAWCKSSVSDRVGIRKVRSHDPASNGRAREMIATPTYVGEQNSAYARK